MQNVVMNQARPFLFGGSSKFAVVPVGGVRAGSASRAASLSTICNDYPEYPPKADLRKLMSQHPLPVIAPGTVDGGFMSGDEATKQTLAVIKTYNAALTADDAEMLESCFFAGQAFWKDQLALTYHMRTFATSGVIAASLLETKTLKGTTEAFKIAGKAQFVLATPILVRCSIHITLCFYLYENLRIFQYFHDKKGIDMTDKHLVSTAIYRL